jgi:hypothetical protein
VAGVRAPKRSRSAQERNGYGIDGYRILDIVESLTPEEVHQAELHAAWFCRKADGHADVPLGRMLLSMLGREDWT